MKVYGLIGNPLGHSFSQNYFTKKFIAENLADCEYRNFETPDINSILPELKQPSIKGLNVTIPFKKNILGFLDEKTDLVKKIGSCNCIEVKQGRWIGHNTDAAGFRVSLVTKDFQHTKALILGSGGASASVEYVLQELGIAYKVVSTSKSGENFIGYEMLDEKTITEHTLIINTTPLGMAPNVNGYPKIPYQYLTKDHYLYDLVYNPAKTIFLSRGVEQGAQIKNGYDMLVIQAEESWRIWNED